MRICASNTTTPHTAHILAVKYSSITIRLLLDQLNVLFN